MITASFSSKTGAALALPEINGTAEQQQAASEIFHQFDVNTEKSRIIVDQFIEEMKKGLVQEGATGNLTYTTV